MYVLIRVLVCCLILLIGLFITHRQKKRKNMKRTRIIFLILSIAISSVFMFLPFENIFITFPTVESAFNYVYSGNVTSVINGIDSDLVISVKNDSRTLCAVPKDTNGWKIGLASGLKPIYKKISSGIIVHVYRYKKSNDYYVTIIDTKGGESVIQDNRNSIFRCSVEDSDVSEPFYRYYACVHDFNSDYIITVNDTIFPVPKNTGTQGDG